MIDKLLSKEEFIDLAPQDILMGPDSYDFSRFMVLNKNKMKSIYGITTDGYLFYCSHYSGDGYNPYKPGKDELKREQFKKEVQLKMLKQLKDKDD